MTMEAEIYGITPSAKIEALPKAPPENMFRRPTRPCEDVDWRPASIDASIPGSTTKHPNLYMRIRMKVYTSLLRSSSILKIFFMVSTNFIMELFVYHCLTAGSLNFGNG